MNMRIRNTDPIAESMADQTPEARPTDALAAALHAQHRRGNDGPADVDVENAEAILAALPEGTAFVTEDSLAAAIEGLAHGRCCWEPNSDAAAIIAATKEAERE